MVLVNSPGNHITLLSRMASRDPCHYVVHISSRTLPSLAKDPLTLPCVVLKACTLPKRVYTIKRAHKVEAYYKGPVAPIY